MLQLLCSLILLVAPFATVDADHSIPDGHAHKFDVPHDDIDALVHLEKAKEKAQFSDISSKIYEDIVNEALHNLTQQFDPIHLPFIPTINFNRPDYNVEISLTLADISIDGLSKLTVTSIEPGLVSLKARANATLPRISLYADHYSAGGHAINLPFSGEGNLTMAFVGLDTCIGFSLTFLKHCAKKGSSLVVLELGHAEVDFQGLDPGTDMGQLINTVLAEFGPDIIDAIEAQLMTGLLHDGFDKILINAINTAINHKLGINLCPIEELWES